MFSFFLDGAHARRRSHRDFSLAFADRAGFAVSFVGDVPVGHDALGRTLRTESGLHIK